MRNRWPDGARCHTGSILFVGSTATGDVGPLLGCSGLHCEVKDYGLTPFVSYDERVNARDEKMLRNGADFGVVEGGTDAAGRIGDACRPCRRKEVTSL